jgi:DNA repair exonuclease SbcCD nuclease subunit
MRIAHLGDLHFGRRNLKISAASGLNQREVDLYDLADALATQLAELKPDIVVIAGDLYNAQHPHPVAIQHCHRFLRRLREAGIPVLLVGGNHDHKHTSQPSPLLLAQEFEDCVLFLQQGHWDYQGVRFHCLPFEAIAELGRSEDARLEPFEYAPCNVLVAHAYADGANISSPPEDIKVPPVVVHDPHFSGVLLGHVHEHTRLDVGGNAFYCGALDRLSFKEAATGKLPAFWIHDLDPTSADALTGVPAVMESHDILIGTDDIKPRPFAQIVIDQDIMTMEELDEIVRERIEHVLADHPGAVLTLRIANADPQLRSSAYKTQWLKHARAHSALWLEPDFQTKTLHELMDTQFEDIENSDKGTMQQRWRDFLRDQGREDLLVMATHFYEVQADRRKVAGE